MVTRLHLSSAATATGINPAYAAWTKTTGAQRKVATLALDNSALADTGAFTGTGVNPNNVCARMFVYGPLSGTGTLTGTIKGQISVFENNLGLNAQAQITGRIIAADGTTVRGTFLAFDASAASSEFLTTRRNTKYPLAAISPVTLTSTAWQAGDYIVLEVGARILSTDTTSTFTMRFGAPTGGTDYPEDESDSTSTKVPWIEFSQTLPVGGPTISGIAKDTVSPSSAEPIPLNGMAMMHFDLSDDGTRTVAGAVNPFSDVAILAGESVIKVDANVTIGGETKTFPCVWYALHTNAGGTGANETYTPGTAHWYLHFEVWRADSSAVVDLTATNAGGTTISTAVATFTTTGTTTFHGPPAVDALDPNLMRRKDGTPFNPIGNGMANDFDGAANDGTIKWIDTLDDISTNGGNMTRLWMDTACGTGIEWDATAVLHATRPNNYLGLGRYDLRNAHRTREFLRLAKDRGIVVMLALNTFAEFNSYNSPRWGVGDTYGPNPYNSVQGGPIPSTDPAQVYTDATAIALFKRRYRYIAGLYGGFENVIWETWNEGSATGSATRNSFSSDPAGLSVRTDLTNWHATMVPYLASVDPVGHMTTWSQEWEPNTGSSVGHFDNLWAQTGIKATVWHRYRVDEPGPPGQTLRGTPEVMTKHQQAAFAKPVIAGETGMLNASGIDSGYSVLTGSFTTNQRNHLKQATAYHNSQWEMMVGMKTAVLPYYGYSYMHESGTARPTPDWPLQPKLYPALAAYMAGEDWGALSPILAPFSVTVPNTVYAWGLKNDKRAYIWIRDVKNQYSVNIADGVSYGPGNIATTRTLTGIAVTVPGLPGLLSGNYDVEVWAPYSTDSLTAPTGYAGGKFSTLSATSVGGVLSVTLPDFTRDIAIKILPAAGSVPPPPPDISLLTRLIWRGVVVGEATTITPPDGVLPDLTPLMAVVTVQDTDGLPATLDQNVELDGSGTAAFSMTATATGQLSAALPTDSFARTVANGWGTADQGGDYTPVLTGGGVAADQAVAAGVATINLSHTGAGYIELLQAVSLRDVTMSFKVQTDKLVSGGIQQYSALLHVVDAANYYRVDLELWTDHTCHLNIQKVVNNTTTLIQTLAVSGLTHVAGTAIWLKAQTAPGIGLTIVNAKAWQDGTTEIGYLMSVTDTAAALQAAGAVGIRAYIGNAATNVPVLATFDFLTSTSP